MAKAGASAPLAANIIISLPENELNDKAGGHHFGSSYLAMEPDRIVSDIENALRGLKAGFPFAGDGCFNPPPKTLGYKAKGVAFAVLDPTVQAIKTADVATVNMIDKAAVTSGRALGTGIIITGKAVVFAADVTARAIIAAAEKASAAASAAAAQLRNIFASASSAAGNVSAASQLAAATLVLTTQPKTTATPASTPVPVKTASIPPTEVIAKAPESPPPVQPKIQPQIPTPPVFGPALISVTPGFGGGGGASAPAPVPVAEVPAPVAPISVPLSVQTPLEGALFATSSVTFSGTTTPGYSVVASYASIAFASTADTDGNWSIALTLPEGTTSIGVVATDSDGNTSDAITRTINVDTTPLGAPSASVAECTASLSASFCLIASTGAALSWTLVPDTAYYAYAVNDVIVATTTGAVATLSLASSASSAISVAAYDAAGNAATSTPVNVYVLTQPVIINEIAWAGTLVDTVDKWMELKNNSSYALDLSRIAITSADGSPYIALSGTLAPSGFYLIEHRAEATSAPGDLVLSLDALSADGEELRLEWGHGNATTTIDATPAAATCSGWCSGISVPIAMTMERTPAGADGSLAGSWQRGISTLASAETDSAGNTISGTPRAENSEGGDPPPLPPIPPEIML